MSITRNSILAFLPHAVGIVVGLATSVITARYLGPSGRGVLSLSLMTLGVMTLVADAGTMSSVTYFVSKKRLSGSQGLAFCLYASVVLGVAAIGLGLLVWPLVDDSILSGVSRAVFLATLAAIPPMLFGSLWMRLMMALDRFSRAITYPIAASVGTLVVTVAVLLVAGLDVFELVLATSAMHLLLSSGLFAATAKRAGFGARLPKGVLREIASYGARTYVGGLVNYAVLRIDAFILNAYSGNADVGRYTMAVTVSEKVWLIDSSVGHATMPEVVARERTEAARMLAATNRSIILLVGIAGAALFILAPQVIGLLYGEDFLPAASALRLLVPGVIAYASGRILLQYYSGQLGRPGVGSAVSAASAVLAIALYLWLIPPYGMAGAAIASSITYVMVFVTSVALFRHATGVSLRDTLVPTVDDARSLLTRARGALGRSG